MGKGGFKDAQTVLNEPNERRLADWKEQAGPEYNAANLERQANANERQILSQGVSYDIANRKNLAAEKSIGMRLDRGKIFKLEKIKLHKIEMICFE